MERMLERRLVMAMARRVLAGVLLIVAIAGGPVATLCAQPPTAAAQDEFLPVDESKAQEHLPAAPLVMGAYAIAWLVIVAYLWSLWSRLSKVEREIGEVSRRIAAGSRK